MSSTYKNFCDDWNDFRTKLGQRSFWEQPEETRDNWFKALAQVYLMLEKLDPETEKQVQAMFAYIKDQYAQRTAYIICRGLQEQETE